MTVSTLLPPPGNLPPADLILSQLGEAVVVVSPQGLVLFWNTAAEQTFGWPEADALGRDVVSLLRAEVDCDHDERILAIVETGRSVLSDYWIWTRDGEKRPVLATITPVLSDGTLLAIAVVAIDITERKKREQEHAVAEEWFRLGYEKGAVPTAMLDLEGRIMSVNPACCEFLGRGEAELVGRPAGELTHPDDLLAMIPDRILSGEIDRIAMERRFVRGDGEFVWGLLNLGAVTAEDGRLAYVYAQAQDITERKKFEALLAFRALHDPLTGLPNRALIQDRLRGALVRASRYGRTVAVILGDVDRFGLVNDTLGHAAGDELLVEVGQRLRTALRATDTVGRFGGDEFVVICEDVDPATTVDDLGRRMSSLFEEAFTVAGKPLFVTISCGVVVGGREDTAESCLRDADSAVVMAKRRGRNRVEPFHVHLRQRAARMFDLERSLHRAAERGELYMAYQPILDLASDTPVAVEALMRWRRHSRMLISPSEFIPLAEESDLILRLGEFALSEAVTDVSRWRRQLPGAEDLSVAVNLSPRQFGRDLVALCERVLSRHDADPSSLSFEITERGVMADLAESIDTIGSLLRLGIRVAIDDFGTGYSSFDYLRRLPVSMLKIDASFVADLGARQEDAAIVRAIVDLAGAIGMDTCAEGVENRDQFAELQAIGCKYAQGYYWHRPMPAASFERWFAKKVR
ncbi:MAG TPA: EAL domain-containing protein [Acidimicrobiales bacterium]|nr:EAL domain-containing protein [Acidimicrobiales bacterium]